jgi:trimeric autotransporter adhesin
MISISGPGEFSNDYEKQDSTDIIMKTITKFIYFGFAPLALACFTLPPTAQAVVPPPDGGYSGLNTAEGQSALFSLNTSTGNANTAVGWFSLKSDVNGSFNTAIGAGTLLLNLGDPSTGNGTENTAVGAASLLFNTTGTQNTAVGAFALFSNTEGPFNTATGWHALYSNTTGDRNTALGSRAMLANTTGSSNTAVGRTALFVNTEGSANVAVGIDAVQDNTTGNNNTGIGSFALLANTTGNNNTATGYAALGGNAPADGTGDNNTADGANALGSNTTGAENAAVGVGALSQNTTGNWNVAMGNYALAGNTTGPANSAFGNIALVSNTDGSGSAAFGAGALRNITSGFDNIGIGENAGCLLTSGFNNIYIGSFGVDTEANTIRIGRVVEQMSCDGFTIPAHTDTYIAGISGQTASSGVAVYINSDGKLGTLTSSARFKDEIKPMDQASEAVLALKPVTFRYKHEIDPKGIPQFGLVAEEVEKVNPDLVARDADGKPYTVRYEAVNAMLLNEFLKEHRKVQELEASNVQLKHDFVEQQKQIQALTTGLQKVSAQLEASKPAPQVVNNP